MQKVFVILLISLSSCLSKAAETTTGQDVTKAPMQEASKTEVRAVSTAASIVDNKLADQSIKPIAAVVPQKANVTDAPIINDNATQAVPTNQSAPKTEPDNKTTDKKEESPKTDVKKEESQNTTVIPAAKEQTPKSEGIPVPQESKPKVEPVPPVPVPSKSDVTTKNGTTTTEAPKANGEKPTLQARGFDGPSFIGGIILTLGLLAIGFMGFKYYKNQTERNYHTL